jgi:hypothetical protein
LKFVQNSKFVQTQNLFKIRILFKLEFCSSLKFKIVQILEKKNNNQNRKKEISSYWVGPAEHSRGRSYPSSALKRSIGAPCSFAPLIAAARARAAQGTPSG